MAENLSEPLFKSGKICYLEIPALDPGRSADFYQKVFNWQIRRDNYGNISFDDTVGQVSGMWVKGRPIAAEPGLLVSIMVENVTATLQEVLKAGGKVVQEQNELGGGEVLARFADPAGNIFCLYQM